VEPLERAILQSVWNFCGAQPETDRDLIDPVVGAENRAIFGPDEILAKDMSEIYASVRGCACGRGQTTLKKELQADRN
jgi:hypothetical protein